MFSLLMLISALKYMIQNPENAKIADKLKINTKSHFLSFMFFFRSFSSNSSNVGD